MLLGMRRRRDGDSGWANPHRWGVVEQDSRHRVQSRGVGFFLRQQTACARRRKGKAGRTGRVFRVFQGQRRRLLAAQDRFGAYITPQQSRQEGQ